MSLPHTTMPATCTMCDREMEATETSGCVNGTFIHPDGERFERIPYGEETRYDEINLERPSADEARNCHDCNAATEQFHHWLCDVEECPRCHRQLLTCQCGDWELEVPSPTDQ